MKLARVLFILGVFTTPVLAFETEEIGTLEATFGDESIAQPTVIAKTDDETSATAYLAVIGGGFSSLSLTGFSPDNSRLDISMTFMAQKPGPQTAPISLEISYSPTGGGEHWTSDGTPTPPSVTFTTFENDGKEGRAVGSFAGELCYAKDYGSEADTGNCRPIEGRFDTKILVE